MVKKIALIGALMVLLMCGAGYAADVKTYDLAELPAAPAADDYLAQVDKSNTAMNAYGTDVKITVDNFFKYVTESGLFVTPSIGNGATSGGYIVLIEDTDNGTNYVKVAVDDSLSADSTLTLPNVTGTALPATGLGNAGGILYSGGASSAAVFNDFLEIPALQAAPASPVTFRFYRPDNDNWDPAGLAGTDDYIAIRTDSEYKLYVDENGNSYFDGLDMTGGFVILPHGTDPSTTSTGSMGVDTDDNFIEFNGNASGRIVAALYCETFAIANPDELADDIVIKHFMADAYPHGVTIKDIAISTSASASDTHVIEEWSDRAGTTQTTVESIALSSSQYQEDDGTLSDSAMAADSFLVLNKDDATDDIDELEITITYYINPGD